jgi:hypothetical protein
MHRPNSNHVLHWHLLKRVNIFRSTIGVHTGPTHNGWVGTAATLGHVKSPWDPLGSLTQLFLTPPTPTLPALPSIYKISFVGNATAFAPCLLPIHLAKNWHRHRPPPPPTKHHSGSAVSTTISAEPTHLISPPPHADGPLLCGIAFDLSCTNNFMRMFGLLCKTIYILKLCKMVWTII